MQKDDYQWVILALGILVVVALIIKPVVTHEPPNFALPQLPALPSLVLPSPLPVMTASSATATPTLPVTLPATTVPVPGLTPSHPATITSPAPTPAWNGSIPTIVQFVDPSNYNLTLFDISQRSSILSNDTSSYRNTNLSTFATIRGQYSGTTQVIDIPFPYWELWYTVEPISSDIRKQSAGGGYYVISPTHGEGASMSGVQGAYSTALPTFTVQVMEAGNPPKEIRTIAPPGGIDPEIWTKDAVSSSGITIKASDPRPWKEKFYEGQKSYYFIVKAGILKSYQMDLKVPTSYIKKS
jgi:hypothetical protein